MKVLKTITLKHFGKKEQGKVRDIYKKDKLLILITTDRISAFDRVLGCIPCKGQILNQLSQFWFEKTKDFVENHMIAVPDPNVMVVKKCQALPIEVVVRGYISGVTKTSLWLNYSQGKRVIYGLRFPNGLKKNQKLPKPIITPTTRATGPGGHDEKITKKEIINRKIVSKTLYEKAEKAALALFARGTEICEKGGLILVDTKYEFGTYKGKLTLIDEVHTPDSSRFWIKDTYEKRLKQGKEPDNYDKEFLRLWYNKRGYLGDGTPPKMTPVLIRKVKERYISVYEKITNQKFIPGKQPITKRIEENLTNYFVSLVIIAGSERDKPFLHQIEQSLKKEKISYILFFASAHKQPLKVLEVINKYQSKNVIFLTVAGRSNALSGFVAANSRQPVIACPPFKDKLDYLVNIHSTLQMPSQVPVMTVVDPLNAVLAVKRIIGFNEKK